MAGGGQFVGREAQLATLEAALGEARAGRGRLLLIGGEPGIGKSRLADTFARGAREGGARVLWGKGWEGAGAPAYWPWIQALRAHIRTTGHEELLRQLGKSAADIVRMLPELGDLVGNLPAPAAETDSSRFQLFDSTTDFLRRMAADVSTVLILDDLHSADTPSILLLRFVAQQLADMRLVLIGTYRDIELTPDHPLTAALGEMTREPTTQLIALRGLTEAEVAGLIEVTSGRPARLSIAARLSRETGGNPLFIGEAVRLLAAEGKLDDESSASRVELRLPTGVREVIARRVGTLSEQAGHALRNAAAIGPEFGLDLLVRLSGSGEELSDGLAEASRAGLIAAMGGGRYRFAHDLVREALYEEMDRRERATLHRQIAEAIESLGPGTPTLRAAELAYHYFEAAERGAVGADSGNRDVARKAHDYARLAGDQAAAALAYEEASRLYQMALAVLDMQDTGDSLGRIELMLSWGEAEGRAGGVEATRDVFLQAATLARNAGQPILLARAVLGYGGRHSWARPGKDARLVPLLQEALLLLGGDDDLLRARLLTRLACAWRSSPDQQPLSDALSYQAVELARKLNDPTTLGYALIGRFYAIWWPGNALERVSLVDEITAMAEALGDSELLVEAQLLVWLSLTERGLMSEARRRAEEVRRLAEELRQPAHIWLGVGGTRIPQALLSGQFDLAAKLVIEESEFRHAFSIARDQVSSYWFHLFLLHREIGGLADVEPLIATAVTEFPWYPCHRSAHVLTLLDLGRTGEARAEFDDLARDNFAAFYRDNEWLLGMALAAEASARLEHGEASAVLLEQLAPFMHRHAMGHAEGSAGSMSRYLGLVAQTVGRLADAERYFRDAIEHNTEMAAWPWLVHSQADYARMLRRRNEPGDAERAAQLEAAALEAARSMGMTELVERLGWSGEVAADVRAAAVGPAAADGALFRREGEYWSIGFAADSFKLRDSKGLQYLAALLAEPGREFLALDLARETPDAELRAEHLGDAGAQLDADAKSAYRARLHELQQELDDAELANDPERADRARDEMEFLARELSRAVGLGGRDRAAGSASERARLSVTRAIRLALERIAEHSPALGDHLNSTIRTGTYCSYRPDTRMAISWQT